MAALSFRDRLLTRRGARAILSPIGIVGGVAVAAVAVVAGLPVVAGALVGVGVWAVNAGRLLPRAPRAERIDPFTLQEPWRRFVQEALQARTRFAEAVERAPAGPLRDRLGEIAQRMQTGVEQCWLIAKRGQTLVRARRGIDLADVDRQLAQVQGRDAGEDADPSLSRVAQSLQVQRATAERLDAVIDKAQSELRLLDARLDEAVARTLELAAHASTEAGTGVIGLSTDVDNLVSEMESLRLALDETSAAAQRGTTPGTPRDLPPGGAR
jgi:methyl-accepting chemotaxis protein